MTIHDDCQDLRWKTLDPPGPVNRLAGTCGTQFILAELTSHQVPRFRGLNVPSGYVKIAIENGDL